MPSEYDFLSPYSRRLRRIGLAIVGLGAFLTGAAAMAAIVALPLFPLDGREAVTPAPADAGASQASDKTVAATPVQADKTAGAPTRPDTPQGRVPDTRETTGIAPATAPLPTADPREATRQHAATATTRNGTDAGSLPRPAPSATQAGARPADADGGASSGEATAAPDRPPAPAAATDANADTAKSKKPTASRRAVRSRQRHERSRSARTRADERRAGREYVDRNGVRYYVVPRASAYAGDDGRYSRRIIIVRPGAFYDDF
jgi:hypothetical protein